MSINRKLNVELVGSIICVLEIHEKRESNSGNIGQMIEECKMDSLAIRDMHVWRNKTKVRATVLMRVAYMNAFADHEKNKASNKDASSSNSAATFWPRDTVINSFEFWKTHKEYMTIWENDNIVSSDNFEYVVVDDEFPFISPLVFYRIEGHPYSGECVLRSKEYKDIFNSSGRGNAKIYPTLNVARKTIELEQQKKREASQRNKKRQKTGFEYNQNASTSNAIDSSVNIAGDMDTDNSVLITLFRVHGKRMEYSETNSRHQRYVHDRILSDVFSAVWPQDRENGNLPHCIERVFSEHYGMDDEKYFSFLEKFDSNWSRAEIANVLVHDRNPIKDCLAREDALLFVNNSSNRLGIYINSVKNIVRLLYRGQHKYAIGPHCEQVLKNLINMSFLQFVDVFKAVYSHDWDRFQKYFTCERTELFLGYEILRDRRIDLQRQFGTIPIEAEFVSMFIQQVVQKELVNSNATYSTVEKMIASARHHSTFMNVENVESMTLDTLRSLESANVLTINWNEDNLEESIVQIRAYARLEEKCCRCLHHLRIRYANAGTDYIIDSTGEESESDSERRVWARTNVLSGIGGPRPVFDLMRNDVIELTQEQVDAFEKACSNAVSCIVGGGGCGKTEVIRTICESVPPGNIVIVTSFMALVCESFRTKMLNVRTPKKIMSCSEIRSCLVNPKKIEKGKFEEYLQRGIILVGNIHKIVGNGIALPEKVFDHVSTIIIDESSTLPLPLFTAFLSSFLKHNKAKEFTQLILCGDQHQLRAVGIGSPFHDIVEYMCRERPQALCELRHSHRCNQDIQACSEKVRQQQMFHGPLGAGCSQGQMQLSSIQNLFSNIRFNIDELFPYYAISVISYKFVKLQLEGKTDLADKIRVILTKCGLERIAACETFPSLGVELKKCTKAKVLSAFIMLRPFMQIITSRRKSLDILTKKINTTIHNYQTNGGRSYSDHFENFYAHDKIVFTVNSNKSFPRVIENKNIRRHTNPSRDLADDEEDILNGTCVHLERIHRSSDSSIVTAIQVRKKNGAAIKMSPSDFMACEPRHADVLTIHGFIGAEAPIVIYWVDGDYQEVDYHMVYTALTRGIYLMIIGAEDTQKAERWIAKASSIDLKPLSRMNELLNFAFIHDV